MTKKFLLDQMLLKHYDKSLNRNGVNGERVANRLQEIAQIGLTPANGSNRPGFSHEEHLAKKTATKWMKEAGLKVGSDGAGNVIGRLEGKNVSMKTILCGSHLDSVPNGGHFDGTLGIIGAIEVVEAWKQTGYRPEKSLEIVIFSDEEGATFNRGFLGSKAFVGNININQKKKLKDKFGRSFSEVLKSVGLSLESYQQAERNLSDYELYIELHIEQGKMLEKENVPCGIVTSIAGLCWVEFTFIGEAGHAGNTPMEHRKDPLVAAGEFISEIPTIAKEISDSTVATVGKIKVDPNGINVIPSKVKVYADMRSSKEKDQNELVKNVIQLGEKISEKYNVDLNVKEMVHTRPLQIDEKLQKLLAEVMQEENIQPYFLPSGAGHDAMILGEKIPISMLFVKSKDGLSHQPNEWTSLNDCVQSIHVMKRFIEKLQSLVF